MAKASTAVADLAQDLAQRLAQDLAQDEVEPAPRIRPPRELGRPTVVVDDVHITYRIIGAGGKGGTKIGLPTPAAAVRRLVTRKPSSVKVREIKAVKGVSFIARQGEAIGLLGSNGSGKSTLLRAIAGLLPVNAGAVYTMGQPSLLGANAALLTELSGEENVIIGLLAMGMSREEAEEMMPSIIEFSGINEHGDNFLGRAVHPDETALEPDRSLADLLNRADSVAHQEDRAGAGEQLPDPLLTAPAEARVTGGQRLVDEEDFVQFRRGDREAQSCRHARRVRAHRQLAEVVAVLVDARDLDDARHHLLGFFA